MYISFKNQETLEKYNYISKDLFHDEFMLADQLIINGIVKENNCSRLTRGKHNLFIMDKVIKIRPCTLFVFDESQIVFGVYGTAEKTRQN